VEKGRRGNRLSSATATSSPACSDKNGIEALWVDSQLRSGALRFHSDRTQTATVRQLRL